MTPPPPTTVIGAEFDRLAELPCRVDHNATYHAALLRHVPPDCQRALDAGCGTGEFTRQLAARAAHVVGIDASPATLTLARQRSTAQANVTFRHEDLATCDLPRVFDCVACIATLHHLQLPAALRRLRDSVRPGGVLLLLDLRRSDGVLDRALDVVAAGLTVALRLLRSGAFREAKAVRAAWAAHGRGERHASFAEIRELCARELPGGRVRWHLFWRWSLVWRATAEDGGGSSQC